MVGINKQWSIVLVFATLVLLLTAAINGTTPNNNMTILNEAEGSTTDDKKDDKDKEKIPEAILKSPPLKTPASETIKKMKDICENKPMGKWDSKERECKFPTYDTNSEKEKAAFEDKLAEEGLWEPYQEEQDEERQAAIDEYNRNADKAHNENENEEEEEEEEEDDDNNNNNRDYDDDPLNDSENVEGGN